MLTLTQWWIVFAAALSAAGWVLSAFRQLDKIGYAFVLVVLAFALIQSARRLPDPGGLIQSFFRKTGRRFRRPLPLIFLFLLLLNLLGGALYPVVYGDALSYKIPRVQHWLAAAQWHWIPTDDPRLNVVGCGMEWIWSPMLLFFKTDRLLFLLNCIAFAMLPGLIFTLFRRLGINKRLAWYWMWILSAGYCYVFQAGGVSNDAFAVVFSLASVVFALRAWQSRRVEDVWTSILAVALLTGVKQTNLPLVLLWLIAVAPVLKLLSQKWLGSIAVASIALLGSVVPISYFNIVYVGNWNGFKNDADPGLLSRGGSGLDSPFWGVVGNLFAIPAQNLLPPLFPLASKWNAAMERFLQTDFGSHFRQFEKFGALQRAPAEQNAGIGFGICLLMVVSLLAARRYPSASPAPPLNRVQKLLYIAPWLALLAFMAKVGIITNARYLASYYPFFFPSLLILGGQHSLIRRRWWKFLAIAIAAMSIPMLIVSRQRPLFPARTFVHALQKKWPEKSGLRAALDSYTFYDQALAAFHDIARQIPPAERLVGYAGKVSIDEATLWKPFGTRKVRRILITDSLASIQPHGIRYIVVDPSALLGPEITIDEWNKRFAGKVVATAMVKPDPVLPPYTVYLVQIPDDLKNTIP